jgi:hypothetical protein
MTFEEEKQRNSRGSGGIPDLATIRSQGEKGSWNDLRASFKETANNLYNSARNSLTDMAQVNNGGSASPALNNSSERERLKVQSIPITPQ